MTAGRGTACAQRCGIYQVTEDARGFLPMQDADQGASATSLLPADATPVQCNARPAHRTGAFAFRCQARLTTETTRHSRMGLKDAQIFPVVTKHVHAKLYPDEMEGVWGRGVSLAMGTEESGQPVYALGGWEIDLARRELRSHGVPVELGGRAFEIIAELVKSAGELVTKNDLMNRVWPGAVVEDNALQVHVAAIRKALGPDRRMLKTAFGRGYRLLGSWELQQASAVRTRTAHPAPTSAKPFATNVPAAAFELIGRSSAIEHLQELLSANRLVTLVGPGGIGKSALAVEVARTLSRDFQGDI